MIEQLRPYDLQVAGSTPILKLEEGKVAKPVSSNELKFYNMILRQCPSLEEFVPGFFGKVTIDPSKIEKASHFINKQTKQETEKGSNREIPVDIKLGRASSMPEYSTKWSYEKLVRKMSQRKNKLVRERSMSENSEDAFVCIVIEDATNKLEQPCILDLKIGTQQHSPKESVKKIERKKQKCGSSTSGSLGLRLSGMRTYDCGVSNLKDKYFGRRLDDNGFKKVIKEFVCTNDDCVKRDVVLDIVNQLDRLIVAVKDTRFRYFGCSLLIAYSNLEDIDRHYQPNLKVIDFANADFDGVYDSYDEGFVFGLERLKAILSDIL